MQNKQKFPAFDGCIVIEGNIVSIMDDEVVVMQISEKEWGTLKEMLRLNDLVDYNNGETPMTVSQFCSFVELSREVESLEAEKERLFVGD